MGNNVFVESRIPCAISLVNAMVQMEPLTKRLLSLTHPVGDFEFFAKNAKITIFAKTIFLFPP